jgi:hydroxymethylglutaryl-CoA lyase
MKIIECPRDAMQGIDTFIPTEAKIRYVSQLLKVGFDTIDFGSFVSPKAIPQMKDTARVLEGLDLSGTRSRLLAIVANERGGAEASAHSAITYLGFPLSISETFQKRNTNKSITEALNTLETLKGMCDRSAKTLVVYISMGFGNPYGDPYSPDLVVRFSDILITLGVTVISIADTVGKATPDTIRMLFSLLSKQYPGQEFGAHLHSTPESAAEKVRAALAAGCRRFDGALRGFGGCPMAEDKLVGNIATETILDVLKNEGMSPAIDWNALKEAQRLADITFPS